MNEEKMALPPGIQFDPTDEELIVYFLCRREKSLPCNPNIIPVLDIYASDPWDLTDDKAYRNSKGDWYFFSKMKQDRSTRKGIWKEVGLGEPIYTSDHGNEIGIKKYLVYCGRDCTDWIMEEYHLLHNAQDVSDSWVLCRVRDEESIVDHRSHSATRDFYCQNDDEDGIELSYLDEIFMSLEDDDQDEIKEMNKRGKREDELLDL